APHRGLHPPPRRNVLCPLYPESRCRGVHAGSLPGVPERSASTPDRRWDQKTQTHQIRDPPFSTAVSRSYFTVFFQVPAESPVIFHNLLQRTSKRGQKLSDRRDPLDPGLPTRTASVAEKWTISYGYLSVL